MIKTSSSLKNSSKGATTYQISINGILDVKWSERLAGMEINHFESETGPISTLTGKVIDQSELFGVLNTLNNYHYSIISVNKIKCES